MSAARRLAVRTLVIVALAITALAMWLVYLGYFSSDPVKIVPPAGTSQAEYSLIFLSGDMGFNAGMGPKIVRQFTDDGVPVIAFNSLTFFRTKRTRLEVADMVRGLMQRARKEFGHETLVLVGQSFGADALQLGLADLTPDERTDIKFVALTVPTDTIYLQASPNELFNLVPADISALPTAKKLDWVPVLCIFGRDETGSLCPELKLKNVKIVALPGGHFLKDDVNLVYRTLANAIKQTASKADLTERGGGGMTRRSILFSAIAVLCLAFVAAWWAYYPTAINVALLLYGRDDNAQRPAAQPATLALLVGAEENDPRIAIFPQDLSMRA